MRLLTETLRTWGVACFIRAVGAALLAAYADRYIHPAVMELIWNMAWAVAGSALVQLSLSVLNAWLRMTTSRATIMVTKITLAFSALLILSFIAISICEGFNLLPAGLHWFLWMAVALLLCIGVGASVHSVRKHVGNATKQLERTPNTYVAQPERSTEAEDATKILSIFSVSIVIGLALYTGFLATMGILEMEFPDVYYRDVTQTVLTSLHQTGMLCMGVGMQLGYGVDFPVSRRPTQKSRPSGPSRGSVPGESGSSVPGSALSNRPSVLVTGNDRKMLLRAQVRLQLRSGSTPRGKQAHDVVDG